MFRYLSITSKRFKVINGLLPVEVGNGEDEIHERRNNLSRSMVGLRWYHGFGAIHIIAAKNRNNNIN